MKTSFYVVARATHRSQPACCLRSRCHRPASLNNTDLPSKVTQLVWPNRFFQAAVRPRDIEKQRELARTSDQSERQPRGGFWVFAQVSGLGCIDLGDRRSRVQISAARPIEAPLSRLGGPSGSPAGRHVAWLSWRSTATRSDRWRTSTGLSLPGWTSMRRTPWTPSYPSTGSTSLG